MGTQKVAHQKSRRSKERLKRRRSAQMGTTSWWKWALAIAAALVALGAIFLRLRGNKAAAAMARADLTETIAKRSIEQSQQRVAELQKDLDKNAGEIQRVEQELAVSKEKLEKKFVSQGLSAQEISRRFNRLRFPG
jgi:uncharacterized protein HemX